MALRNILLDDDLGLLKKSRIVTDFNKRLHILIDDMRETLLDARGLGLAAPQVGVLRRVVLVVEVADETEPGKKDYDETYSIATESAEADENEISFDERIVELVNPELVEREGTQSGSEGCLSMPGVFGLVTRPQTVKVKAQDRHGKEFTFEASGMTARAICHEIDHLNGILFTSVAERLLTAEEVDEMRKREAETEGESEAEAEV